MSPTSVPVAVRARRVAVACADQERLDHYEVGALHPAGKLLQMLPGFYETKLAGWAKRLQTALEFFADADAEVYAAEDESQLLDAMEAALNSGRGVRQILDSCNEKLLDEPELMQPVLLEADRAVAGRLKQFEYRLSRQRRARSRVSRKQENEPTGLGLWGKLWGWMKAHVEQRDDAAGEQGPPSDSSW